MNKWFTIWMLILLSGQLTAQQVPQLSHESKISLLTCGPGKDLYATFGHSALRVHDPLTGLDRIYNYGTFDFNTPNFYLKFATGTPQYVLSVTTYPYFFAEYVSENRSIREQILNLTPDEKQELFRLLEINYQPANRYYRYDFLFDNCSTRIRDIVIKATQNRFRITDPGTGRRSFRELLKPYIDISPWTAAGINLLLASGTDRQADWMEHMFLPDEMEKLFRSMKNEENQSLVASEKILFSPTLSESSSQVISPALVFTMLLILVLVLSARLSNQTILMRTIDTLLFFFAGVIGILMIFLWFFSAYTVTNANLNLLWAFPLHLVAALVLWIPAAQKILKGYTRITFALMVIALPLMLTGIQNQPLIAYLLFITLGIRLFSHTGWQHLHHQKPQQETKQ